MKAFKLYLFKILHYNFAINPCKSPQAKSVELISWFHCLWGTENQTPQGSTFWQIKNLLADTHWGLQLHIGQIILYSTRFSSKRRKGAASEAVRQRMLGLGGCDGQGSWRGVYFSSLVPNYAGLNQAWGKLTFILWWPHVLKLGLLTLNRFGYISRTTAIRQLWGKGGQKKIRRLE